MDPEYFIISGSFPKKTHTKNSFETFIKTVNVLLGTSAGSWKGAVLVKGPGI